MSSPFTVTKLVRWRIKDWISCFYACRFPLEDEHNMSCSTTPQKSSKKLVFDPIGDSKKKSMKIFKKKMEKRKELVESSAKAAIESKDEEEDNDSNWPRFSEEDYIVFCFQEDGGIHVVEDKKSDKAFHHNIGHANLTSRPVCRKLNYIENAQKVHPHSQDDTVSLDGENNYGATEEENHISDDKAEGKGSNDMEEDWPPDVVKEISHIGEVSESKTIPSAESSDSYHSTGSTGSFTFPALGWEWMGSPAQMPNPEGGPRFGKHKARSNMRIHCCTF